MKIESSTVTTTDHVPPGSLFLKPSSFGPPALCILAVSEDQKFIVPLRLSQAPNEELHLIEEANWRGPAVILDAVARPNLNSIMEDRSSPAYLVGETMYLTWKQRTYPRGWLNIETGDLVDRLPTGALGLSAWAVFADDEDRTELYSFGGEAKDE